MHTMHSMSHTDDAHATSRRRVGETLARLRNKIWYALELDHRLRNWSDESYLKLLYRVRMGRRLRLDAPSTFSEKIQWLKLYDRQPIYTRLVDKYEVKGWVAQRIGDSHVVPTLGVWDSFQQIDFDRLPEQFVLKCTHDSGGLVICTDRASLNLEVARTKINRSLSRNYFFAGREWPYRDVQPRVIAEIYFPTWAPKRLSADELASGHDDEAERSIAESVARNGVFDYKFYCFHGEPTFLYVSQGLHHHPTAEMAFLSLEWKPTGFSRPDYIEFDRLPPKPSKLDEMIAIARKLSRGIPFVRVDLFQHRGRVLFSEMTFHPVSGMMPLEPRSADSAIGKMLDLSLVDLSNGASSQVRRRRAHRSS